MRVACCQLAIAWQEKAANYARVEQLVGSAGLAPQTLLLLPEMFATGFTMQADEVAEPLDGPTARFLADLARRQRVFVQAGLVVQEGTSRPRNEALVFAPDGRRIARYAKLHLFSYAREPEHYTAGSAPAMFRWQDVPVAPAICYDLRFPELFRGLVQGGASLLAFIACWPAAREEHWLTLLRARAIENQCGVAAVNRCGSDPHGMTYSGRSQIIDARGNVLADAGYDEALIQADVDFAAQADYREQFAALRDRRFLAPYFPDLG
jgi:omega-amidase